MQAAAIILAGGGSTRMGRNKAVLPWHGTPLIQHIADQLHPLFEAVLVSANDAEVYSFLGLPIIQDRAPAQGPLMGLYSALAATAHDWNFVIACDIPVLSQALIESMYEQRDDVDCVVPITPDGTREPLCAFYHRRLAATAQTLLYEGRRSVQSLLDKSKVRTVPLPSALPGINTPQQYEAFLLDSGSST
ncbi:MAG: molybdenum cofactor guanylyltransferase [Candidatus Hydrogenedentes bacterium]|nr:molybdenum cofactor guanylyltransferase [Candidatus Hydrogenedentota bacterium]